MQRRKAMGKLILLRHGESVWNKKNVFTGWIDIGLSERGVEESLEAGDKLADIAFDAVYVSKLVRAQMTALIALSKNKKSKTVLFSGQEKESISVVQTEALNERHYGELQGKNKDAVKKEFGEEQFRLWRRSYDVCPPGGESLKMTIERALPFCQKEIFPRVERGETVLVCAHGNSIRGIVMYLDKLSKEDVVKLEIPTGVPLFYDLSR